MLDALGKELSQHVDYIMSSACGEGQGWVPAMQSYGLTPGPESATVPAPEAEVRDALWVVVRKATAYIDQVCASGQPVDQTQLEGIRSRLARMVDHEIGRYNSAVAKSSSGGAGVSSIFQNAVQTAQMNPWANLKYDRKITVTCKTCGAAQQAQANFTCEFCGSHVFDR